MGQPQFRTQWQFSAPNGESVPLMAATPVCQIGGRVLRASASSYARSITAGIVVAGVSPTTLSGALPTLGAVVVPQGLIELAAEFWIAATGDPNGLVQDAIYYLGLEFGRLTTTPPSAVGQYVVAMGVARSKTLFSLRPNITPVLL